MRNWIWKAAAATLALAAPLMPAHAATLFGQQLKVGWRLPDANSPFAFSFSPNKVFTVGNGIEGTGQLQAIQYSVDFTDTALTMTFLTNALFSTNAFNGIVFDQQGGGTFTQLTGISGIATSRVSRTPTHLAINFSGQRYNLGDKVVVTFANAVPEPASWALMIGGFGVAGCALRTGRRRPEALFA